ncbi:MAG: methylmalonyl-CoA mutase, partial [Elusimicrobia bacterium]|nr:methylmalonyl-CoA mutase [Elusimicrobiota bacterium]
ARGTWIYPPAASLRLCTDVIEFTSRKMPQWHPISISGYHIREAGSSAVQELAFTFANAEVYVRSLLERGLSVDEFGPRLAFFFGCHNHLLEEVAKFRAARRIWARLMKDEYKASDPKTLALKFHVQTCGSTLTGQQPVNNVMRVAWQALAAVLGGAQSLHTIAYDEALALPSEDAAQLALRTQQILAYETGVVDCVDPLGGAYAVEALTDQLEAKVLELRARVAERGGMLKSIEQGFVQAEIQESAYRYQKDIEAGRRKIVGVNAFVHEEKAAAKGLLKVSPELEAKQVERLKRFKKDRSEDQVRRSLEALTPAAKAPRENTFPHILAAVESGATLGEVCGVLRGVFGEHHGG